MARDQIVWDASKSAEKNASEQLPLLAQEYFLAGRALFQGEPASGVLHRFRLETKRLRYTLELFRSCYGPGLDRRLDALRNIQDFLGELNDCAATQKLVGKQH